MTVSDLCNFPELGVLTTKNGSMVAEQKNINSFVKIIEVVLKKPDLPRKPSFLSNFTPLAVILYAGAIGFS